MQICQKPNEQRILVRTGAALNFSLVPRSMNRDNSSQSMIPCSLEYCKQQPLTKILAIRMEKYPLLSPIHSAHYNFFHTILIPSKILTLPSVQKQSPRGILVKRRSENMRQIYRTELKFTSVWVFSCFLGFCIFSEHLFLKIPLKV